MAMPYLHDDLKNLVISHSQIYLSSFHRKFVQPSALRLLPRPGWGSSEFPIQFFHLISFPHVGTEMLYPAQKERARHSEMMCHIWSEKLSIGIPESLLGAYM